MNEWESKRVTQIQQCFVIALEDSLAFANPFVYQNDKIKFQIIVFCVCWWMTFVARPNMNGCSIDRKRSACGFFPSINYAAHFWTCSNDKFIAFCRITLQLVKVCQSLFLPNTWQHFFDNDVDSVGDNWMCDCSDRKKNFEQKSTNDSNVRAFCRLYVCCISFFCDLWMFCCFSFNSKLLLLFGIFRWKFDFGLNISYGLHVFRIENQTLTFTNSKSSISKYQRILVEKVFEIPSQQQ